MKEFIEKLIGRLEEYKDSHLIERDSGQSEHCLGQEDCEMMDCTLCVWDKAIEIVNQLAEEYKGGWIPVDRTLPKKSGYYTVTEEQYSLDMRRKIGIRVSHEVQFDAEEQMWHRAKFLKVIAWKEHEAPYQTKGE